ncbi:MAG: class I SAM-dependent methyltransferase [Promethearchaeota archaeon]|nr:MAG: class I SAM-dependent methyltransferase [Candidatus Lokiarchaeota archaeon]
MTKKEFFIKSSYADDWSQWVHDHHTLSPLDVKIIKAIDAKNDEIILEIGAGEGKIAQILLRSRIQYIGLDISHRILNYAKNKLMALGFSNFHLIVADAEYFPFRSSMDKIFYYNTLFFIPNRFLTLRNASYTLKNSGKMIIDTTNFLNLYYILLYLNQTIRNFGKWIANRFHIVRKLIKLLRKRDYNPYFRPGSKGNILIILWELRKLGFKPLILSGYPTNLQQYFLRIIKNPYLEDSFTTGILKLFSGRILIQAEK